MSSQPSSRKPSTGGKRRWFQFSLRTALFLTLLAAAACAWFTRREWLIAHHAQGAVEIRAQVVRDDGGAPARQGRWKLYDERHRERASGKYAGDSPAGQWTYYRPDGQALLQGECRNGRPQGLWTESYADGSRHVAAHYENGLLHGEYARWWQGGKQQRVQGRFTEGRRAGRWTVWDKRGKKRSEGAYVEGQRHGAWRFWDARGTPLPLRRYVLGRETPRDARPVISRWLAVLEGRSLIERGQAAWAVATIGEPAVPSLLEVLSSPSAENRAWAASVLGSMARPDGKTIEALTAALDDSHITVQCAAAAALGHIGPPAEGAAPGLRRLAGSLGDGRNDLALAALACVLPDERAPVRTLLRMHAPDARRRAAVSMLGGEMNGDLYDPLAAGDASFVAGLRPREFYRLHSGLAPALLALLAGDDNVAARLSALALGAIGHRHEQAIPGLIDALGDQRPARRAAAATAIGLLPRDLKNENVAVKPLDDLAKRDPSPAVRKAAKAAADRIRPESGGGIW